jgi:23S rRNA (uracil1939-C5)-methyltransferase
VLRLVTPGTQRREAPCPFYDRCGGCTLEHLRYEAQLEAKARIVADAISRIGRLQVELPEVVPSPLTERYRNRVSFALRREESGRVVAGFHSLGDPDEIVDIDGRCLLPEDPIARVWDQLRASWGPDARRLPSGERLRLTLRGTAEGAVSLLVEGGFASGRPQELVELVEGLESVWHRPGDGAARLLAGAEYLTERWGNEELPLAGEAFLQVNRGAARLLEEYLLAIAGDVSGARVVDSYCGVGLYAQALARAGAKVVGIELDRHAIVAARAAEAPGVDFRQGTVEELLPGALPATLVVLNPPRVGIAPEVADALLAEPPDRIIYVSCAPATLARDLRRLADRFQLDGVRAFDLFPQTAHVETVASLSIAAKPV